MHIVDGLNREFCLKSILYLLYMASGIHSRLRVNDFFQRKMFLLWLLILGKLLICE